MTSPWSSPTPRSRRLVASAREAPSGQIVVQVCQGSIRCCVGRLDRGNEGSVVRARCAKGVQRGERSKILRPIRGEIGDGRSRHLRRVGVGGSEFRALLTDFWHIGFGQSGDFAVHTPKRELERRREASGLVGPLRGRESPVCPSCRRAVTRRTPSKRNHSHQHQERPPGSHPPEGSSQPGVSRGSVTTG